MALSVRCEHCGWLLAIDEAFAGARCRCSHCGDVTDVPGDAQVTRALPRPPKPNERRPIVQPAHAEPHAAVAVMPRLRSRTTAWLVLAALLVLVVASPWLFRTGYPLGPEGVLATGEPIAFDRNLIARVPAPEMLARLKPSFLEKPTTAPLLGWLIDGGNDMREYYADVTTLVATSIALLSPADQKFALYLASGTRPEFLQMTPGGPSAVSLARDLMRNFRPSGAPKIAQAFDEMASWQPQTVFLILAQSTDDESVNAIISRAKKGRVTVFVTTIGKPNHGWARVSWGTGGEYVCLRAGDLKIWVDRVTAPPLPQFEGNRVQVDPSLNPLNP